MARLIRVKFLKGHPEYAYFKGDVGSLSPEAATALQNSGHVIVIPETEGENNPLPEDLPARSILFETGIESLDKIKETSDEALLDIDGVGKGTLKKIREYLK